MSILASVVLILSLIVFYESASGGAFEVCTVEDRIEALDNVVSCQPRKTVVPLPLIADTISIYPSHALIGRCGGSCWATPHNCFPTVTKNVSLKVTAVSQYSRRDVCTDIILEEHVECQCGCVVSQNDCGPTQFYDIARCKCVCENVIEKTGCLMSGKVWNDLTCSCSCPERSWTPCSTGFRFDYLETCSCVRIIDEARLSVTVSNNCNSFLVILVIMFVCMSISVSATIFYVKSRRLRMNQNMLLNSPTSSISVSSIKTSPT